MWSEEDFVQLEREEMEITEEQLIAVFLTLGVLKSNLEDELHKFYSKYGKDGVVTYSEARKWVSEKDHRKRFTVLTLLVMDCFESAFNQWSKQMRKLLTDIIIKESAFFDVEVEIDKLLSKTWGLDNLNWLDKLEYDKNVWVTHILNDIKKSMLKQETLEDVLKQLDKRIKTIDNVLETLGINESTAVGSLTRQDIFQQLGIKKYQIFTKVDERRCDTCGELHGCIFPVSAYEVGVTASPFHHRCRCFEIPITN